MKKFAIIALTAILATACGTFSGSNNSSKSADSTTVTVYTIDSLIKNGEALTGTEVAVRGFVTHTCKHSGKRCFIVNRDQNQTSFRVEAGGKIGGFNRELTGSELIITGIVMERRLSKEYLDQYEEKLNTQLTEDGSAESCQSELKSVKSIKEKLQAEGKDYYSTYYLNGIDFEVVE